MRAGARESPGRTLGWQPPGPSAVPGVVAAPPLPRRHLSRSAVPRLRHSKVGRKMKRMRKRRIGRNELEGRNKVEFENSIQRPQVPRILKPTFEQSTSILLAINIVQNPARLQQSYGDPSNENQGTAKPMPYGAGGLKPVCRLILGVFNAKCSAVGKAYSLRI